MKKQTKTGVVVGRFQVPNLTEGHRYLIDAVRAECEHLFVAVGVHGGFAGSNDPMDFETRKVMINSEYPEAVVAMITDHSSDEEWSRRLDASILESFPEHEVTLYGSRDSFLPYYKGRFPTKNISSTVDASATRIRKEVAGRIMDCPNFRSGVIYANSKHYPTSFHTVDIAIRHSTERKVLVGRKKGEVGWRFPGGFVDPKDQSLELAAKREAKEEVGDIEISDVRYTGSVRINDHRYRNSEHKIMTSSFIGTYVFGHIKAGDDLDEVRWQDFDGLMDCLLEEHKPLGELFLKNV